MTILTSKVNGIRSRVNLMKKSQIRVANKMTNDMSNEREITKESERINIEEGERRGRMRF